MGADVVAILVGVSAALLAYGLWQVGIALHGNRRKLAERLVTGGESSLLASLPGAARLRMNTARPQSRLTKWAVMRALDERVEQAYPALSLDRFVAIAAGVAVVGFVTAAATFGSPVMGLVGFCAGLAAPMWLVEQKRGRKVRKVTEQLPEALDFMVRVLRAGHGLSSAMKMMGEELDDPLAGEFARCYDQHSLGQPMEDCLKEMSGRVRSTDFAFFVTAVLIQRQTGGDLSVVLENIGSMVRQRVRLAQHVKAKTAEGRFTGYILVAFPAVMFVLAYVLNPKYAGTLVNTSTGLWMLGTAGGLEVLGLFAIRKITTVKV